MTTQKHVDVEIDGSKFRIETVKALDGEWCVSQMMSGKADDEDIHRKINYHLLEKVSLYKTAQTGAEVPMRIFAKGNWMAPAQDLEYNLKLVNKILSAAIKHNFSDFFVSWLSELKEQAASASTTNQ